MGWLMIGFTIWCFPEIGIPPKSPILTGFSIINHLFWSPPIYGNLHITPIYDTLVQVLLSYPTDIRTQTISSEDETKAVAMLLRTCYDVPYCSPSLDISLGILHQEQSISINLGWFIIFLSFFAYFQKKAWLRGDSDQTHPLCSKQTHSLCGAMATLTELTVRQVGQVAPPLKQRLVDSTQRTMGHFFRWVFIKVPQVFGTAFCLLSLWYHFNPITVIYYITIRALTHPHMSPLMGQGIELRSPNFVLPIAILKGDHVKSHQVQNSVGRCLLGVIVATDFVDAHT